MPAYISLAGIRETYRMGDILIKAVDGRASPSRRDGIFALESALTIGLFDARPARFPVNHEDLVTDPRCIARVIEDPSHR